MDTTGGFIKFGPNTIAKFDNFSSFKNNHDEEKERDKEREKQGQRRRRKREWGREEKKGEKKRRKRERGYIHFVLFGMLGHETKEGANED